ncbi:cytochrome P450 [Lophiotrema nucula]|uniref:Cytochrome P450 n=1 Tax=Lophiotrema nucula TaxID=690887 RepID=A0A6A5ZFZ9_9PLEO|nr:cytochrome P450 [Lophiotrema nucula]
MGLLILFTGCNTICYVVIDLIYNTLFHSLSKVPGPFWSKLSSVPFFYHAIRGDRHIWTWQLFQLHGDKIRTAPNVVLFRDPDAYNTIFSWKANVRKSNFYAAWQRNEHAKRRRLLNLAFTERSLKASGLFMERHVDRWNELFLAKVEERDEEGWRSPVDISKKTEFLMFDNMGDLAFGADFRTKEPGDSKLKAVPHVIKEYMAFANPIAKSPLLGLIDADPDTGELAYKTAADLMPEANLLIIAASHTTNATISSFFFYFGHNPRVYRKLVQEIRSTFTKPDEIAQGPKLTGCTYLRACIDEAMRFTTGGPSELPRVIQKSGQELLDDIYPEGVEVGCPSWSLNSKEATFGDATTFRPEHWIPYSGPDTFNPPEEVARIKKLVHGS